MWVLIVEEWEKEWLRLLVILGNKEEKLSYELWIFKNFRCRVVEYEDFEI